MRLDSLIRLVEGADWMSFRELALLCLDLKGYREVSLSDGAYDGGTDLMVYQRPPNPTRIAVQLSVQKKWKNKLDEDVRKAKSKLGLDHMVYVSSRRIPEADFAPEKDRIWSELGVTVNKIDSQAIATEFYREKEVPEALRILGIDLKNYRTPSGWRPNFRSAAAASFGLFGKEPEEFRHSVVHSAVVSAVYSAETGLKRDALVGQVADIVQMSDNGERLISAEIDRMLQRQELLVENGQLRLDDDLAESHAADQALLIKEHEHLQQEVATALEDLGRRVPTDDEVKHAVDCLGALLLEAAKETISAFEARRKTNGIGQQTKQKLRDLHILLDSLNVPEGSERDRATDKLGDVASSSPAGRRLFAGELFFLLTQIRTSQLVTALGARSGIEVVLDASVAIPILCGLLFETTDQRSDVATYTLYEQLTRHAIPITIPQDYLEEVTAHLLYAARDYGPVIGSEPDLDLVKSENAFVAHYTRLYSLGRVDSFPEYLASFGYTKPFYNSGFFEARDGLQPKIGYMFSQYSIQTRSFYVEDHRIFNRAQGLVVNALKDLEQFRADVLQEHDARTVGYFNEHELDAEYVHVLCTWDNLYSHVRDQCDALWEAVNPAVLSDLLSVSSPDDEYGRLVSPLVIAGAVSEESSDLGAAVWDRLMQIERGKMHDAQLVEEAKKFKRRFIDEHPDKVAPRDVEESWARWKAQNVPDTDANAPDAGNRPADAV